MKELCLAVFMACMSLVPAQAQQPNIILVYTDDLPVSLNLDQFPNISSIAENGVTFDNSFVDFPLCTPSRASLFSGLASHNHGVKTNSETSGGGWASFEPFEANAVSVWMQSAGYRTGMIGKYVNGYDGSVIPPGWDDWFAFVGRADYWNYEINDNGSMHSYGSDDQSYSTDVIRDKALAFLQDADPRPFFLVVAPYGPHLGRDGIAEAPERYHGISMPGAPRPPSFNEWDVSDKPGWVRSLGQFDSTTIGLIDQRYRWAQRAMLPVDEMVGDIVSQLGPKIANTYICFTSDNGFFYGEHRIEKGKVYPYEAALRVPLMCRGPGIPQGETREQMVTNLDVVATILDWANATPGRTIDGKSFVPVLANQDEPWRSAFYFSGDRTDWATGQQGAGVRSKDGKYIQWGTNFEELYDTHCDPDETNNLAGASERKSEFDALKALRDQLKNCSGAACWVP